MIGEPGQHRSRRDIANRPDLTCQAAFFVKRPAVPWKNLIAYGLLIGAGQFGLLFIALKAFISPGLASPPDRYT